MTVPKINSNISVIENGISVNGKVTSYTFDALNYGSNIIEKKYFVHWQDGRITKESTGIFYDRKIESIYGK